MRWADVLMIVAVLSAPIVAVQVQRWVEDYRRKSDRKEWIFKTLMATRAETLSRDHVNALNMIDLEYYEDKKGRSVVHKWREYLDHLGSYPPENSTDEDRKRWSERKDGLLVDLLQEMAHRLGYKFDKVLLKKGLYSPRAYSDNELEQMAIRRGLVELLHGQRSLPVMLPNPSVDEDELKQQEELRHLMLESYRGHLALRIKVEKESET